MEQHPIPQQISSYQFRLVGDMTLKQFFQLAGGALFSLLFYASPLHPLIKWPFIIFFALLGVALAFLPFQERPLEKWIIAFFRSIYSPTLFSWQKSQTPYIFFQPEAAPTGIAPAPEKSAGYVPITSPTGTVFSKLENAEKTFLSSVAQLFGGGGTTAPFAPPASVPAAPKGPLEVPLSAPTSIAIPGMAPRVVVEEKPLAPPTAPEIKTSTVTQTVVGQSLSGRAAQYAVEAAPPNPPTVANTVVGQIFDKEGKIINGAILEIRDSAGRPVRALKSNMLGHFIIVTPLQNGTYEIITEKEGFAFEPVTFEAKGEVIPPIALKAKGSQMNVATEEMVSSQQLMAA